MDGASLGPFQNAVALSPKKPAAAAASLYIQSTTSKERPTETGRAVNSVIHRNTGSTTNVKDSSSLNATSNKVGKASGRREEKKSHVSKIMSANRQRHGEIKPRHFIPSTNLTLFQSIEDLVPIVPELKSLALNFDNTTINPILPSSKIPSNPLTMWNIEIPLNYSIHAPMTSTIAWSNCTTLAFYEGKLRSGFRNQIMAIVILILEANRNISESGEAKQPHGQILLKSLGQKDTYGTNWFIPFAKLWDVAHWNSHYPQLPRLVDYDPILHSQFDSNHSRWYRTPPFHHNTFFSEHNISPPPDNWFGTYGLFASPHPMRPYGYGYQHRLMAAYTFYGKGKGRYAVNVGNGKASHRNPAEILMLQGAMRPHPNLQAIIDRLLIESSLLPPNQSTAVTKSGIHPQLDYMTLHARVEPDMQKHVVCKQKKVLNLTEIFDFLERQWKDPPVAKIFMPINRQYLELEGDLDSIQGGSMNLSKTKKRKNRKKSIDGQGINWIAVANLQALNHARDHGLWNGRAKVLEFGANSLQGTSYANKPSTAGAMLNFFIGVPAKIFIGTEVSSFSHDLLATRFFRGYTQNYKYLPDGLHDWTPPGTIDPPGFVC